MRKKSINQITEAEWRDLGFYYENDETKWHDPFFWPEIKENESGFIHKLSVRRNYAGMAISKMMVEFEIDECKKREINVLRLDCAGDREKLKQIYENMGFRQVARRMVGCYDIAFYELKF